MPFTPIHMGPGIAIKSVLQDRFSLMVFGWSQIVIDLQPLFSMLGVDILLHGFSHSLIGASLLGLIAAISGRYLGEIGLRILKIPSFNPIKWSTAFLSAFIGVYSHVTLDSIMHSDVFAFAPFSLWNPLYQFINLDQLHLVCLLGGLLGALVYFIFKKYNTNAHRP